MEITFAKLKTPETGTIVFPIAESGKLSGKLKALDDSAKGAISKAIKVADYKGKKGKCLAMLCGGETVERIVLIGIGGGKKEDKEDALPAELEAQQLGGKLCVFLNRERVKEATLVIEQDIFSLKPDAAAAAIAQGVNLRSYRFDKYFTKQKEDDKPSFTKLNISLENIAGAKAQYTRYEAVASSVYLTRDLVSEPPNVLYPESYAAICKTLKNVGLKVEVLDEAAMEKLGMGSLLAVGHGSVNESQLVVMQWNGAPKTHKPLAFVGKGVTFDSGGISIKPSQGMEDMKYDMAGSAAVVGVMRALALRKAKVNAVGVIGLVENMPSGSATRPSDIVTSMSGQTVEILNTDAEGRLVLADALWYTQSRFKPQFMVNLATLTGAITIALGNHKAGLFSNNDMLAERLFKAGEMTGERLWRLPLGKEYDKQIDSKAADMQNISNAKGAGSITAAQFLQRFVNDVHWAHLDIAGMAWANKPLDLVPEGATAFGVRLLDKFVEEYYEK